MVPTGLPIPTQSLAPALLPQDTGVRPPSTPSQAASEDTREEATKELATSLVAEVVWEVEARGEPLEEKKYPLF